MCLFLRDVCLTLSQRCSSISLHTSLVLALKRLQSRLPSLLPTEESSIPSRERETSTHTLYAFTPCVCIYIDATCFNDFLHSFFHQKNFYSRIFFLTAPPSFTNFIATPFFVPLLSMAFHLLFSSLSFAQKMHLSRYPTSENMYYGKEKRKPFLYKWFQRLLLLPPPTSIRSSAFIYPETPMEKRLKCCLFFFSIENQSE